jgi:hypothetical protein
VSALLAQTIPLALAAAISPVLFLLQLTTLTDPRRLLRGSALALGAAVPLVVVGAVGVAVGASASLSGLETVKATLDLALGAVLVAIGLLALVRPPAARAQDGDTAPKSARRSFLTGVAGMATNVTTFALYVPALKLIAASDVGDAAKAAVTVVVTFLTLTVVLVPLALTALAPTTSGRILSAVSRWMHGHQRWIRVVLGLGFGIWLVAKGAGAL